MDMHEMGFISPEREKENSSKMNIKDSPFKHCLTLIAIIFYVKKFLLQLLRKRLLKTKRPPVRP